MGTDEVAAVAVAVVPTVFAWVSEITVASRGAFRNFGNPLWFWGETLPAIYVWHVWLYAMLSACYYASYRLATREG